MRKNIFSLLAMLTLSSVIFLASACVQNNTSYIPENSGEQVDETSSSISSSSETIPPDNENDSNINKEDFLNPLNDLILSIANRGTFANIEDFQLEAQPNPPKGIDLTKGLTVDDFDIVYSGREYDYNVKVYFYSNDIGNWLMTLPIDIENNEIKLYTELLFFHKQD